MNSFTRIPAFLCLILFLLVQAPLEGRAAARERILSYDVAAVFDLTGEMEVTEKIIVQTAGDKIQRGIYRVLPIWWNRADHKRFRFNYTVKSLQRDGKGEPYSVTSTEDDINIRAGSKDVFLPPGQYTYALTYTVSNHFSRFPDWDELYWNVTGNDWDFPIDKVRFSLYYREQPGGPTLPLPVRSLDVYTGRLDEQGKNARILPSNVIETVSPLRQGEGVTVAWTWPRGLLKDAPDPVEYSLLKKLFVPKGFTYILWVVPVLLLAYFLFFVRSRLQTGPMPEIIPLFKVPENFTPGQLRYAMKRRYDDTSFAADLLNIVAKGAANLSEWKDRKVLKRGPGTRKTTRLKILQPSERAAVDGLFSKETSVSITKTNRDVIEKARNSFRSSILRKKDEVLLSVNKYIVVGAILQILGPPFVSMLFFSGEGPVIFTFVYLFIGVWATFLLFFASQFIRNISSFLTLLASLPFLLFLTPFFIALGVMCFYLVPLVLMGTTAPDGYTGVVLACFFIWLIGSIKLPRRTAEGRRRYAIAQGLAMYLGTAERDRFVELYPPEESVEHFEELLPYALALDKGKTWANRFQRYLEETGEAAEAFSDSSWHGISSFRSSAPAPRCLPYARAGGGAVEAGSPVPDLPAAARPGAAAAVAAAGSG